MRPSMPYTCVGDRGGPAAASNSVVCFSAIIVNLVYVSLRTSSIGAAACVAENYTYAKLITSSSLS